MSTLQVENLIGPTSGSNANKVIIPSGQTLHAAGHVIQVISNQFTASTTINSTAFSNLVETSITPSSTSSKVLVIYNYNSLWKNSGSTPAEGNFTLYKNGSSWLVVDGITPYNSAATNNSAGSVAGSYLESPSTTSQITYSMRAHATNGTYTINTEGGVSALTVMEIAQ